MISNLFLPQGMLMYFHFCNIILLKKKTIRDKTKVFFDTVFWVLSPQRKPFREFETFLSHLDV